MWHIFFIFFIFLFFLPHYAIEYFGSFAHMIAK
jgi:hypothetical protein